MPKQDYHADPLALHTTRRDMLKRCPRRFMIEYVLGLTRESSTEPMRMGSAFAFALEHNDPFFARKYYDDEYIKNSKSSFDADLFAREAEIVSVYAELYLNKWPELVAREVAWKFPLDPYTGWSNAGTMDFVLETDRGIFAGEDKLKGQWTENDFNSLDVDDQVTGEIYALKKLRPNDRVIGLKYRVTKKSQISQRLKRNPESFPEFLNRLREKLLEEKDDRFMEFTLTRTDAELKEFEDELFYTIDYIKWNIDRYKKNEPAFVKQPKTCAFNGGCAHPMICCSGGSLDQELLSSFYSKKDFSETLLSKF